MPDSPQVMLSATPDRIVMPALELSESDARYLAQDAVFRARQKMPRVTGATASRMQPIWGQGYIGIWFPDAHTWFMEHGTRPFTMRSLKGKVIPMWITDTDGSMRASNPKAEVRSTEDGRTQVLIFRRATNPGAPGRINRRVPGKPWNGNSVGGRIAPGNNGIKWRHPGVKAMGFMNSAISDAVFDAGLFSGKPVYIADAATWELSRRRSR